MSVIEEIEAAVPALHRYARSLVTQTQDADDLVQDCLERALGHLRRQEAQPALSVRPWLFTILHNLGVSRWRSLRRRGAGATVDAAAWGSEAPGQEWALSVRDLLRGFDRLSVEHRQVLLLVGVEGLAYGEVAGILDVPVGTVMSRLSRARDALRTHMNGGERAPLRRVK